MLSQIQQVLSSGGILVGGVHKLGHVHSMGKIVIRILSVAII